MLLSQVSKTRCYYSLMLWYCCCTSCKLGHTSVELRMLCSIIVCIMKNVTCYCPWVFQGRTTMQVSLHAFPAFFFYYCSHWLLRNWVWIKTSWAVLRKILTRQASPSPMARLSPSLSHASTTASWLKSVEVAQLRLSTGAMGQQRRARRLVGAVHRGKAHTCNAHDVGKH